MCDIECIDGKKLRGIIPTRSLPAADVRREVSRVFSDSVDVTDWPWGARGGVGPLKKPVQNEPSLVSRILGVYNVL